MDAGAPRGRAKSDINVTPLIDIVLVLLIVFIVLIPGLTRALPVAVPRVVKTPVPVSERNPPLVVTLDAGGLMLQSGRIELSRLADALVPAVQLQPAGLRRVFLKVDGALPWQKVVDVMDQIRAASERAKRETALKPDWAGRDGGDIKVAITLKK
jgi:biopolymer transport protein ExbD